jgi:hypothetical protein
MSEWAVRHRIKRERGEKELCFTPFENKKSHKEPNRDGYTPHPDIRCSEIITCFLHYIELFREVVVSKLLIFT